MYFLCKDHLLKNKSIFLNKSKYLFHDFTRTYENIIIIRDMNVNSTDKQKHFKNCLVSVKLSLCKLLFLEKLSKNLPNENLEK